MSKEHNGAGIWFDPERFTPNNEEIVAMDCFVKNADGVMVRIIQTGMYEVRATGREVWHAPQQFDQLWRWMRYPTLIDQTLKQIKKPGLIH